MWDLTSGFKATSSLIYIHTSESCSAAPRLAKTGFQRTWAHRANTKSTSSYNLIKIPSSYLSSIPRHPPLPISVSNPKLFPKNPRYMNLDAHEIGYFITQVGLAAASFGVTKEDVTAVGESLGKTFGYRCAPPAVVVPAQKAQLQSICLAEECPLSANDTCAAYDKSEEPFVANATLAMGLGRDADNASTSATGTASGTGAMPSQTGAGASAASIFGISFPVLLAAGAVFALGL